MSAILPAPKNIATRLKLNKPINSQTSPPIITSVNAIIVVIFIFYPLNKVFANLKKLYKQRVQNIIKGED